MVGGHVVQVINTDAGVYVEVLDTTSLYRCWRLCPNAGVIREGDLLWWQGNHGYHTPANGAGTPDFPIGPCHHAKHPHTPKA